MGAVTTQRPIDPWAPSRMQGDEGVHRVPDQFPRPGWAPDPWDSAGLRYWDGSAWSGYVLVRSAPPPDPRSQAGRQGGLAAILGLGGLFGSLLPLFGFIFGIPAPIAMTLGVRSLMIRHSIPDTALRPSRRWAITGIILGGLGTVVWLFWCILIVWEVGHSRDPFRGL